MVFYLGYFNSIILFSAYVRKIKICLMFYLNWKKRENPCPSFLIAQFIFMDDEKLTVKLIF